MENSRSDERDDSLHSRCWDPHIRMALCSVETFAHRGDGDIRASRFQSFTRCGDYSYFNRFCSGIYVSLLANPIMEMGEPWDVGRRTGMFLSISAIGALTGPPISGAIKSATGDFKAVGYYAG